MPCFCGERDCLCTYFCRCRSFTCFCTACLYLRNVQHREIIERFGKHYRGQTNSQSSKQSVQSDRSNEQMSSLVNYSPPGQSLASVSDQRRQTLDFTPATETPKPSPNDHPTLIKQLNQPLPPLNYPNSEIKRQLSEPPKIPVNEKLLSELPIFHKNPSTGGSSSPSVINDDPYLPFTSNTVSSTAPSTSGLNKDFKSGNATNSISKKVPTSPSDSSSSCANIEYIKKASDKALPSYESFSSRFTTPLSDENNHRNFGSIISTSRYQDAMQTSTDYLGRTAEIATPLIEKSSTSCSNSGSQSLHLPLQLSPQDHPLDLSLSADDKHKISISHSSKHSTRRPSPVPSKKQRMDTMEFSNIPTSEDNNQSAESSSGGSRATFSTKKMSLSWDPTAEGSYPKTRTESTASTPGSSAYTSCMIQNPSKYTGRTEQFESPMDSENLDENPTSCPSWALSTSASFAPPQISHSFQASPHTFDTFQPISSDENMVLESSIAPSTVSMESNARSFERLPHHSQGSTSQSASSGIYPSQSTARHRDDGKGENNYTKRSKKN